ncbi:MAG: hypothetical protein E7B02_07280, partial [Streptococcus salivarius]|nr:hypothetical protein [Streptococcus salivarius]
LRDLINDSWNLVVDGLAKRDQKRLRPDSTVNQLLFPWSCHNFLEYVCVHQSSPFPRIGWLLR